MQKLCHQQNPHSTLTQVENIFDRIQQLVIIKTLNKQNSEQRFQNLMKMQGTNKPPQLHIMVKVGWFCLKTRGTAMASTLTLIPVHAGRSSQAHQLKTKNNKQDPNRPQRKHTRLYLEGVWTEALIAYKCICRTYKETSHRTR